MRRARGRQRGTYEGIARQRCPQTALFDRLAAKPQRVSAVRKSRKAGRQRHRPSTITNTCGAAASIAERAIRIWNHSVDDATDGNCAFCEIFKQGQPGFADSEYTAAHLAQGAQARGKYVWTESDDRPNPLP